MYHLLMAFHHVYHPYLGQFIPPLIMKRSQSRGEMVMESAQLEFHWLDKDVVDGEGYKLQLCLSMVLLIVRE